MPPSPLAAETDHADTVSALLCAAEAGHLTTRRLKDVLTARHGKVLCYPDDAPDTDAPLAYFIALEGDAGAVLRRDFASWRSRRIGWDLVDLEALSNAEGGYIPPLPRRPQIAAARPEPYPFAATVEGLVRCLQGDGADRIREAVLVTDTWNAAVYEHWRGNLEQIRRRIRFAAYLVGRGGWVQRLF